MKEIEEAATTAAFNFPVNLIGRLSNQILEGLRILAT